MRFHTLTMLTVLTTLHPAFAAEPVRYLPGRAYKIPSQYTNQESGYFALVTGRDDRLYIGAAKYGVDAYLIEFDPKSAAMKMIVDVHQVIGSKATGFAAQAKIHSRNNVGASGMIYFASKQGYPEKGEKRGDYPGGYAMRYDPKTGKTEHFGIAKAQHGIISIIADESRGLAYVSTCSDERPIDHSNFMILDLAKKTYRDLGDMEQMYAFIVLDDKGRAYHPIRGGKIARYDPTADRLDRLNFTIDGAPPTPEFTKNDTILNWETSPDHKTLYAVEMTTNQLFAFDLTSKGEAIPGKRLGALLSDAKRTDCRALNVGPDGRVWAAVSEPTAPTGQVVHLVGYRPGTDKPRDYGVISIANPDFTKFTDDKGKPLPWHHTIRKEKDGTFVPWQPMGVSATTDGSVYVMTIAPFTLVKFTAAQTR